MATKKNPSINAPFFHDDDKAREYLESIRWANGRFCPHCGTVGSGTLLKTTDTVRASGRVQKARQGLYKCTAKECRKQFSVTVGTVFERSHIPLSKWLMAAYLLCSSKKGISSHQLHRTLGVTYKTAWFLSHRIRHAMSSPSGLLGSGGGTVEADETYLGRTEGQGKGPHLSKKRKVFALTERGGAVRSFHVQRVVAGTLGKIMGNHIDKTAHLMTDTAPIYHKLGSAFASHETVNHSKGEYVRGEAHTNTIEGVFSIFKRGMVGTYQHCGEQHLQRYLSEFDFRYNHRVKLGLDDMQRTDAALRGIEGKRLTYRRLG